MNVTGIYDSGSNVSLINSKILKIKDTDKNGKKRANLRTINGVNETEGMITITAKILDIEHKIDVFIVNNKNFNYELLIGLDCIKKFKLTQNEDLKIEQRIPDFAERYENGENLEYKRERSLEKQGKITKTLDIVMKKLVNHNVLGRN